MLVLALAATEHNASLRVSPPEMVSRGNVYELAIPGMGTFYGSGSAGIPCDYLYYPLPPGVEPVLSWVVNETSESGVPARTVFSAEPFTTGEGLETTHVYPSGVFPSAHDPVSVDVVRIMGASAARVRISPFCYGSSSRYVSSVSFTLSHPDVPGGEPVRGALLEEIFPGSSVWWPGASRRAESVFWGSPWARIRIDDTGFHSVTGSELEAAGCAVTGSPSSSISMFSGPGEMFDPSAPEDEHYLMPVAISVLDGDDGFFDAEDSLVFFGQALWHWKFQADTLVRTPHRYDDASTYWLTWGGDNGARITQQSVSPSGGTPVDQFILPMGFEQEVLYDYQGSRTSWMWGFLFETTPGYFYLASPFASDNATFRMGILKSGEYVSSWAHNLVAELDGTVVLDSISDTRRTETYVLEGVSISQGGNMLKLWSDFEDYAYLDYAEFLVPINTTSSAGYLCYAGDLPSGEISLQIGSVSSDARIFDLVDPHQPLELVDWSLNGALAEMTYDPDSSYAVFLVMEPSQAKTPLSVQYAQPGRLTGTVTGGDVLLAVPEEFENSARMMENICSARGVTVAMATYREIYEEFGQGVSDPGAVRSWVRWALDTWEQPPSSLVLIGDGSSDPLGHSTGSRTLAPVYVELVTSNCFESFFTTVHEGMTFPEIPVSRIPADSEEELLIALQKSWVMETASSPGPWQNTVIVAADDEWGTSDTEDYHVENSEILCDSLLPRSLNVVKHYLIEYPWPPGTTTEGLHPEKPQAASDLVDMLNQGASSITYSGHGSYDQMASEKLFSSVMVSQLNNAPRYFLYNSFSCHNGQFNLAAGDCLSEALLFHPDGGAAVTFACTGGSGFLQNKELSIQFLNGIYEGEQLSVAESFWLALWNLQDMRNLQYCVLGDGGTVIPMGIDGVAETVSPDSLFRGRINTVDVSFPVETSFLFNCMDSADEVTYVSPLTENFTIDYLRYGSTIYSGVNATDADGNTPVSFFVPLQADTGAMGRLDASGAVDDLLGTGYSWPLFLVDDGNHADDQDGPEIDLEFADALEGPVPTVYQNAVLRAELSDPSGICVLGEDAGSIVICSIDGEYEDVTDLFTFNTGSSTSGGFEYSIPDLLPGRHQVRVVARDGMKNTGEELLSFDVLQGDPPMLDETGVFPNPGRGIRAFFFTTGSMGTVKVRIYTVAGRPVWSGEKTVSPGANQIIWNGHDADGDQPAAGSYIYTMEFSGSSGTARVEDILVVSP